MTAKEIINIIDIWYSVDPSYYAAKALCDHGVSADQFFDLKDKFGNEGRTRWIMVWMRMHKFEKEKGNVNTIKPAKNADETNDDRGNGSAPGQISQDDIETITGV